MTISRRLFIRIVSTTVCSSALPAYLIGQSRTSELVVRVSGFRNSKGKAIIGLWNSKQGFPRDVSKSFRQISCEIADGKTATAFIDVPYGEYAVALYHDENGNGKLDTRFPGIPTEGLGSSNNPHPKFSAPTFIECSFEVKEPHQTITIDMGY